jgi:hypothetical protein
MKKFIPKAVSLHRQKTAWEMRLTFHTYEEIAEKLQISEGHVAKILCRLHKKHQMNFNNDVKRIQQEQIASLEKIIKNAFHAFEISRKAFVKMKTKKTLDRGNEVVGTENITETDFQDGDSKNYASLKQAGDSKHLKIAMDAMADIRFITGANAPTKSEVKNLDLTEEELYQEAKKIFDRERLENEKEDSER